MVRKNPDDSPNRVIINADKKKIVYQTALMKYNVCR